MVAKNPEQPISTRSRELTPILDVALLAMGSLAETRNHESTPHIRRTAHFVKVLAEHLSQAPPFRDTLTPTYIDMLFRASPLHDLGKAGVPDRILLKPEKLTDAEFKEIQNHTIYGRDALRFAARQLKVSGPFLDIACAIAASHHERWDGTGYPEGLKAEAIPLPARLMTLADVYDALVTYRVYKPAFSHEVAVEIIKGGSGSHFDPEVVSAFLACESAFRRITLEFTGFEQERVAQ